MEFGTGKKTLDFFSPIRDCPANYTCLPDIGENPNFGFTNFDHFGWAMLNTFQLITLDFWEDPYNLVWSGVARPSNKIQKRQTLIWDIALTLIEEVCTC